MKKPWHWNVIFKSETYGLSKKVKSSDLYLFQKNLKDSIELRAGYRLDSKKKTM